MENINSKTSKIELKKLKLLKESLESKELLRIIFGVENDNTYASKIIKAHKSESSFCATVPYSYSHSSKKYIIIIDNWNLVARFEQKISTVKIKYSNEYYFFKDYDDNYFKIKSIDSNKVENPLNLSSLNQILVKNSKSKKSKEFLEARKTLINLLNKFQLSQKEIDLKEIKLPKIVKGTSFITPIPPKADYIFISAFEENEIIAFPTKGQSPGDNFVVKAKSGITKYHAHFYMHRGRTLGGSFDSDDWDNICNYKVISSRFYSNDVVICTTNFGKAEKLHYDSFSTLSGESPIMPTKSSEEQNKHFNLQVLSFCGKMQKILKRTVYNIDDSETVISSLSTVSFESGEKFILVWMRNKQVFIYSFKIGVIQFLRKVDNIEGKFSPQVNISYTENPVFFTFDRVTFQYQFNRSDLRYGNARRDITEMRINCYTILKEGQFFKVKNLCSEIGDYRKKGAACNFWVVDDAVIFREREYSEEVIMKLVIDEDNSQGEFS